VLPNSDSHRGAVPTDQTRPHKPQPRSRDNACTTLSPGRPSPESWDHLTLSRSLLISNLAPDQSGAEGLQRDLRDDSRFGGIDMDLAERPLSPGQGQDRRRGTHQVGQDFHLICGDRTRSGLEATYPNITVVHLPVHAS
jgi:hypothetical protein